MRPKEEKVATLLVNVDFIVTIVVWSPPAPILTFLDNSLFLKRRLRLRRRLSLARARRVSVLDVLSSTFLCELPFLFFPPPVTPDILRFF